MNRVNRKKRADDNIGEAAKKIKKFLSEKRLSQIARDCGFLQRLRNLQPYEFIWSLILCFSTNQADSISSLHRSFIKNSGVNICYSSWHDQLSKPEFPLLMGELYQDLMTELYVSQQHKIPEVFREFSDVLIHDGSSWAINDYLAEVFPGRFTETSPAAIEMHNTYSLLNHQYEKVDIAPDSMSEHDFIPSPDDVDLFNKLLLFDRGYVNLPKLNRINEALGFYIVRAKENCNPVIICINKQSARNSSIREGKKLKDVRIAQGKSYDFNVTMMAGNRQRYNLRLLVLWNKKNKQHSYFLTNLSAETVSLDAIGKLYRLRWQIELTYKELKSFTSLKKFQTENENIVEGFIWTSIIAMQLRRFLVLSAEKEANENITMNDDTNRTNDEENVNEQIRLSTHKAAINASDFMYDLVICAFDKLRNLKKVLRNIFDYIENTMKLSNPHRPHAFNTHIYIHPSTCYT